MVTLHAIKAFKQTQWVPQQESDEEERRQAANAAQGTGGPSDEPNPWGDCDSDWQKWNDEWRNRVVVGGDLPDEHWLREIPTTGPANNNTVGIETVCDKERPSSDGPRSSSGRQRWNRR